MDPFRGNKLLRYPERLAEWKQTGKPTGPVVVDLDLTNACPHNCPACPGGKDDPTAHLTTEEAKDYLRQFRESGTLAVSFGGGGDPLAHPACVEIFEYANEIGLSVGVITNGHILKDDWAKRIMRCVKWLRVSLDAVKPSTFAKTHGVTTADFYRVMENIRTLGDVYKRGVLGIGFLTSAEVADEIYYAAALARNLGVDYIQFRPFNYDGYDATPDIKRAKRDFDCEGFQVLASWPKYERIGADRQYDLCRVGRFCAVVNAYADMLLCCDMKHIGGGKIGNLRENTLAEIWATDTMEKEAAKVNLAKCPPLCRGNAHNILLAEIATPMTHEEFL